MLVSILNNLHEILRFILDKENNKSINFLQFQELSLFSKYKEIYNPSPNNP